MDDDAKAQRAVYMREWKQRPGSREIVNATQRRYTSRGGQARLQAKRRRAIVDYLGGVCSRCGFDDERALQVDHIDGGGTREARDIGTYRMMTKVLSGTEGYQLLCANCNWIKRYENNECSGASYYVNR